MENANRSLEYQYASTYHNLLDKIIDKVFITALPKFGFYNDAQLPLVRKTVKEDLLSYCRYKIGYPILEAETLLVEDILKRGNVALEELIVWLKIWNTKYLERTSLISTKQYQGLHTRLSRYVEHARMVEIEPSLMEELVEVSKDILIQNKEYACVSIMARDIVIYSLRGEYKNVTSGMNVPDQLRLMGVVIRRTRSVASMIGPLVFIKVK